MDEPPIVAPISLPWDTGDDQHAVLRAAAEARAERLRVLCEVATEATGASALPELLQRITSGAARLLTADLAILRLWDEESGGLRLAHCAGDPEIIRLLTPVLRPGEGTGGIAWQENRALSVSDYGSLPNPLRRAVITGERVSAGVVLGVGTCRLGTLVVTRRRAEPFTAEDVELLDLFGKQAAQAIEHQRLLDEARMAAERLAASEARFRRLIEEAPDAIFVVAADGTLTTVNAAAERLAGRTRAELIGQAWNLLLSPEHAVDVLNALFSSAAAQGEVTLVCPDGTTVPVALHAVALSTSGPEAYLAIAHDLSERKKLEAQLVRAERMRTMGELAGGVAHNVNNLLSIILGHAELLRLRQRSGTLTPGALNEHVAEIVRAVDDGAAIVRRLLEFTRTAPSPNPAPVDVAALIDDVLGITRPRWEAIEQGRSSPIELVLDLPALPPVLGVAGELRSARSPAWRRTCSLVRRAGGSLASSAARSSARRSQPPSAACRPRPGDTSSP